MDELERLIDLVVSDAQLANGCPPEWLQARGFVARSVEMAAPRQAQDWTESEEKYYLDHVGEMSYEDIAAALGRTVVGVRIHAKRKGFPPASRVPGWMTAHQVALLLGVDSHKVPVWVDEGIIPGERLPFRDRVVRRVKLLNLKLWLIRPTSWLYFQVRNVKNGSLRRLVLLAQQRWGDEWLSTSEAAELLGCEAQDVERQIKLGKVWGYQARLLSGRHVDQSWAYWFLRRSDLPNLTIRKGKGSRGCARNEWSPRADEFILRARTEGKSFGEIARMMKWSWQRVRYRVLTLEGK